MISGHEDGSSKFDSSKVRSTADVEGYLADASGELIKLALVGRLWGLNTPETDQQLAQIATNIAESKLNLERADRILSRPSLPHNLNS